ncbi:aldose epimerase family protein [Luteococcus sanguinis]|uniref:Aldose 1-epimerase n=1 Tax=Luteococcus sanguinis TaxID=174038 RepID=A0ABW1X0Q4_9ACTN
MSPATVFGTLPDGREVRAHELVAGRLRVQVLELGAIVNRVEVDGQDVAIGFDTLEQQQMAKAYFGAVVGRYANRLAKARYAVDGREFRVTANEGANALHGGVEGFDARLWTVVANDDASITLELVSPDGDQGFGGELTARATYTVADDALRLELSATTDAPTVCALTSHLYLNLAGSGSIDDNILQVNASGYVPIDAESIPLGTIADVAGTPFDLRQPTRVGDAVRTDNPQVSLAKGIDHSFDIDGEGFRRAARVECPTSGRVVEVWSDQPALQVYTGNFLDGLWTARGGRRLRQGDALALEPHVHPDTPNQPWEGDAVLRPGEIWNSTIEWRFAG